MDRVYTPGEGRRPQAGQSKGVQGQAMKLNPTLITPKCLVVSLKQRDFSSFPFSSSVFTNNSRIILDYSYNKYYLKTQVIEQTPSAQSQDIKGLPQHTGISVDFYFFVHLKIWCECLKISIFHFIKMAVENPY